MPDQEKLSTAREKHTERTLLLIKPEAVRRGISLEVLARFERAGLKVVGLKITQVDRDFAQRHYRHDDIAARHGESIWSHLLDYITEGPVVAAAIEGINAVDVVRKISGSTESASAQPGTIRGDYSHHSYAFCDDANIAVRNVIHASASKPEAEAELRLWFSSDDLVSYRRSDEI